MEELTIGSYLVMWNFLRQHKGTVWCQRVIVQHLTRRDVARCYSSTRVWHREGSSGKGLGALMRQGASSACRGGGAGLWQIGHIAMCPRVSAWRQRVGMPTNTRPTNCSCRDACHTHLAMVHSNFKRAGQASLKQTCMNHAQTCRQAA